MSYQPPSEDSQALGPNGLMLTIGCHFGLESTQSAESLLQGAPRIEAGVSIHGERWDTSAEHHTYIDHYGNRCERFALLPGDSQVTYEAQVLLAQPNDVIEPD